RMITINLGHYDRETEIAITQAKSSIAHPEAEKITDIVRDFRQIGDHGLAPTVRAAIMIAKVLREAGTHASSGDQCFQDTCLDILGSELRGGDAAGNGLEARGMVLELIKKHCQQGVPA
ncbi:MAG: gas vesicle protein GvpN, partial [Dehalococcoidia bacterium]